MSFTKSCIPDIIIRNEAENLWNINVHNMADIEKVLFGSAYESWCRISKKFHSTLDVVAHLFEIHDQYCKQCLQR